MEQASFLGDGKRIKRTVDETEAWLRANASEPWVDGYMRLRSRGMPHGDAMLAVWLSLRKDDRGDVKTRDDFAAMMGVAKQTTYDWEEKRPEIREWSRALQVWRLQDRGLAEVDDRTYHAAIAENGSYKDRELFYRRAGVWEDEARLHLVGAEDGPVEYVDVSEEELDAIRLALQIEGSSTEG